MVLLLLGSWYVPFLYDVDSGFAVRNDCCWAVDKCNLTCTEKGGKFGRIPRGELKIFRWGDVQGQSWLGPPA